MADMSKIKMASMRMEPAKNEQVAEKAPSEGDRPAYPWGLSVHLDDQSLSKLGLDRLPQVGKPVMIHALADVTNVSEQERVGADGKKEINRAVALQITNMGMGHYEEPKEATEVLYGKK
jgi:hypothetical protein